MKFDKIISIFSLLAISSVSAKSRSDFFGENDSRPELFKILDDHVGTIKIKFDDETWSTMKEKTVLKPWDAATNGEKYGTNNATLEFVVDGTDYKAELQPGEFTFQLGGKGSRNFAKPGYNIKIENGSFFDVKLLRLRSTHRDLSLMREKFSSDLLYRMGVPTTSTNYVNVEVNGEKLGLYVLTNKIKKDFIKKYYGEKKTENLYECKDEAARFEDNSIVATCNNVNDDLVDFKDDLQVLVDAVNNAKTADDVKDIIDIDAVLKTIAFEFISLSWDHFLGLGHNYFWYKKPDDGKWMMILNDFDETWGQDIWQSTFQGDGKYVLKSYIPDEPRLNLGNMSIRDCDFGHKIVKLLIYDDDTRWREILGEIVKNAFNPKLLVPRIDDLADLIRDDLAVSREIIEETGHAMGCFNTLGYDPRWNMTQFEDGINYAGWISHNEQCRSYPLKFLVEERFRYICHTYAIDPETLELIQPRPAVAFWGIKNKKRFYYVGDYYKSDYIRFTYPDLKDEPYMQDSYNADPEKNNKPTNYKIYPSIHEQETTTITTTTTTTTKVATKTTTKKTTTTSKDSQKTTPTPDVNDNNSCWSEVLGYPCCKTTCHIYSTDNSGNWGYEDDHWCGIPNNCTDKKCWSEKYGYNCCKQCFIYDITDEGKWGFENNEWCGILEENCD